MSGLENEAKVTKAPEDATAKVSEKLEKSADAVDEVDLVNAPEDTNNETLRPWRKNMKKSIDKSSFELEKEGVMTTAQVPEESRKEMSKPWRINMKKSDSKEEGKISRIGLEKIS